MSIRANISSEVLTSVCNKVCAKKICEEVVFWLLANHSNLPSKVQVITNDTGNPKNKYFPFNILYYKSKCVERFCEDVASVGLTSNYCCRDGDG